MSKVEAGFTEHDCYHRLLRYVPQIATVIDIGAAEGYVWCYFREHHLFEQAKYVFIDCMSENIPHYQRIGSVADIDYLIAAMGAEKGSVALNVDRSPYLTQRSDHKQVCLETVETRIVPSRRIDEFVAERGYQAPYFLRIDVQGAEAMVLSGADGLVPDMPMVTIELSILPAPETTTAVWDWLIHHGYRVYCLTNFDFGTQSQRMNTVYITGVKKDLVPADPMRVAMLAAAGQVTHGPAVMETLAMAAGRLREILGHA